MTSQEIRNTFPNVDPMHSIELIVYSVACILTELTAQIAELNEKLSERAEH